MQNNIQNNIQNISSLLEKRSNNENLLIYLNNQVKKIKSEIDDINNNLMNICPHKNIRIEWSNCGHKNERYDWCRDCQNYI